MKQLDELAEKIAPLIAESTKKVLGINILDLDKDITEKISKRPLIDFMVNTAIPFKQAKRAFKKQFLKRMLQLHYGNVSEVARIAEVDRRSIHRLVKELNTKRLRKEMLKPDYVQSQAVDGVVKQSLSEFSDVIHPDKLKEAYQKVGEISQEIKDISMKTWTLKEAEAEFEQEYVTQALAEHGGNVSKTARAIGLRYETLQRKLKKSRKI